MIFLFKNIILFAIIFLCITAYQRNFYWHTPISIWSDTIVKSPLKARPHNGLGIVYSQLNDRKLAIKSFSTAIELNPALLIPRNNLGVELFRAGLYPQAKSLLIQTVSLNFVFPEAHNSLGAVYAVTGDLDQAISEFNIAHEQDTSHLGAMLNLSRAYILNGKNDKASIFLDKIFKIEPYNQEALNLKKML